MDSAALFNVFIFLAAACLVVPLASRFQLGSVLGYLIAGIAIGPAIFGFIGNAAEVMHFAEFGVIMMLFLIGMELEPPTLWRMRRSILGLGGLQLLLTTAAFVAAGIAFGYDWRLSLAVAMALSLSSTALVLQMLTERNLMQTEQGEASFSVLLFQDIAVIPMLIILPWLAAGQPQGAIELASHSSSMLAELPGWSRPLVVLGAIGAMVALGRYGSRHLFRFVARTQLREVFTATALALVVGITLLMQLLGVSPALGAFVAGVVLANSEYKHTLETDLAPFKGLLLGLFFISVGMGMDFGLLATEPLKLLGLVALLVAVKAAILWLLGRAFGMANMQATGFALALAQGGEFAFVLFQFAGTLGLVNANQSATLTLAVALSIAVTPVLMAAYGRFIVPRFMSLLPEPSYDTIHEQHPVILAGYGRFGQIVGRFMRGQGVEMTVLEKDPEQIELLRKFGFSGFYGDATRLDLLQSAGAGRARMLIIAVDTIEDSLAIVRLARQHFPQLHILARARNRRHASELHKLGVEYFKRELFDSSLSLAQHAMVMLGHDASAMRIRARQFRKHDETMMVQSFVHYDDESALVSFARQSLAEMERILQSDITAEVAARKAARKKD